MFLDKDMFSNVVESTPLFAIDLLVLNENKELLVGKRLNPPAKGYFFVPGGRVFKNESLSSAFQRLTLTELGSAFKLEQAQLLGLYEHFYQDSVFGDNINTHYINGAHFITIKQNELALLPIGDQHADYYWFSLSDIEKSKQVHQYTKDYLPRLRELLDINELD